VEERTLSAMVSEAGILTYRARSDGSPYSVINQAQGTYTTEDIASAIASNDPSLGLRAALALHRLAERVEADHVATARQKGWSWQQIGDALGVTRQSVHAKYGKRFP
jgi:hypothetical protein